MEQPQQFTELDAARELQLPTAESHKFTRGVLGLRTGSAGYAGAAVLGAEAAWRTGVGLVQFVSQIDDQTARPGLPTPAAAVLAVRPETVVADESPARRTRCHAWLIGSGTSPDTRSALETDALLALLRGTVPVVADAGALTLLTHSHTAAPTVITPHLGELRMLLDACGLSDTATESESERTRAAGQLASRLHVTVLLKGSRTIAVSPSGQSYVTGPATPWLATAGTGDVLAGILGALVSGHAATRAVDHHSLARLGAAAALIHDRAALDAAGPGLGRPITALEVAHHIPPALAALYALRGNPRR